MQFPVADLQAGQFFCKMNYTTSFNYGFADGCDDLRKFIGANMGMCFIEDLFRCAKMHQAAQDPEYIASFAAAGIQLAIAIGTCPTFSETIIAFGVDPSFFVNGGQVAAAGTHIFSSFKQY